MDEETIKRLSAACMADSDIDRFALAARTLAEKAYIITPAQLVRVKVPILAVVPSLDGYVADFIEPKKLRAAVNLGIVDQATYGGLFGATPSARVRHRDWRVIGSNRTVASH